MAADVEEGAKHAVLVAEDDDRLARDLAHDVVARLRETGSASHAVPAAREDPLALLREDRLGRVVLARERARALLVQRGRLLVRGHDLPFRRCFSERMRLAASQPGPPKTPGPGWLPAPPKYSPSIGVPCRPHPATGRMKRI